MKGPTGLTGEPLVLGMCGPVRLRLNGGRPGLS